MATVGFPGSFNGSNTTGYLSIGALQKIVTSAGFPGSFQAGNSVGYLNIGAVQKNPVTMDNWHPNSEKPYSNKFEMVGY